MESAQAGYRTRRSGSPRVLLVAVGQITMADAAEHDGQRAQGPEPQRAKLAAFRVNRVWPHSSGP
jgi:hypothetical protein